MRRVFPVVSFGRATSTNTNGNQWRLPALIGAIALSVGLAACTSGGSKPPGTPTPQHFGGTQTVGALFRPGSTKHLCTASVVDSTPGNLLITAAHCISGTAQGYTFAPGYHGGTEPFGSWTVVRAYGAPKWIANQAPQSDFAFLVVGPRQINGQSQQIQQVTGGNQLGTAPSSGAQITVPAYPQGSNDNPITCVTHVYYYATYPTFNCDPYVDGTSGAPWLQQSGQGSVVVGVLGGLHQGGCPSWTSYSSPFGPDTLSTYSRAAAGAKASTFPTAGGNGC
jgi:V8-like Glu-specific endopeptidase